MATYPISDLEKKAWKFAKKAHEGVKRKYTDVSYFDGHVRKVFGLLKQFDIDPILGAAALLHDTVEDVEWVTSDIIKEEFGVEVANLVKELTSIEEYVDILGKADYLLDKMYTMSDDALLIKLCDRLQNLSDHYTASKSFRQKYFEETKYIIDNLSDERQLNIKQRRVVEQINGILDNMKGRYDLKYLKGMDEFD